MNLTFITGNQHKADYLAKWLALDIPHQKLSVDELQSLDLSEVAKHKALQAYELIRSPVLVEDVGLTFHGMHRLPGPFIKWFLEELGPERLCQLADTLADRSASAAIVYALYDGHDMHLFESEMRGHIAQTPRSMDGNGWKSALTWNSIFVPDGSDKTYAEMTDEELVPYSHRAKAIEKLKAYLTNLP